MRRSVSAPVPPLQRKRTKGPHFVGDGIALLLASGFSARSQVPSSASTAIRPVAHVSLRLMAHCNPRTTAVLMIVGH
jgi:hypothetical protein